MHSAPSGERRSGTAGFVQVLALSGLALAGTVLTYSLVQSQRTSVSLGLLERQITGNSIAASVVRMVLAAIDDPNDTLEVQIGTRGLPHPMHGFDLPISVAIEGEGGKIDIINADPAILSRYLEQAGLTAGERALLIDRLGETRRIDDAPAAMEALLMAFASHGASDRVSEDFTMRSRLSGIDPRVAGERVLRAIPDLSEADVRQILRARQDETIDPAVTSPHFATGQPRFTIVATVQWSDDERLIKRVPIEITTGGRARVLSGFR